MEQQKKRKPMNKVLYYSLIGIFAAIFLGSAIYLARHVVETQRNDAAYDQLASIMASAQQAASEMTRPSRPTATEGTTPGATEPDPTAATGENGVLLEYEALYKMNNDMIGWITIPDTRVNYPVMYRPKDIEYYLYKDFYGKYSQPGSIYVSEYCDPLKPSDNVIIYGHRMNSGAMFGDLMYFRDEAFWQEHQTFTYNTIYEHQTYQIISVFITTATEGQGFPFHTFINADNAADFDAFIDKVKSLDLYETGITAEYGDQLVCLCTCTPRTERPYNGRLVVVAKKIK